MRTEEYRDFDTQLSTINRNFSHGLFLSEQFLIDNDQLIETNPETLTKDIYLKNQYRKNFNFRLKCISDEIKKYQKSSFMSFYIFLQSAFELYIDSLYSTVNQILYDRLGKPKNIQNRSKQEGTLQAICEGLNIRLTDILDQEELDTLDYLRLKRNCIVHADGKPSDQLMNVLTKGQQLNAYWEVKRDKDKRTMLTALNFSSDEINQFDVKEIIETIIVLRDIAKKVDQSVLSFLNKEDIISYILQDFKQQFAKSIIDMPRREIERRFAYFAKIRFCIEKKEIQLDKFIF